MTPPIIHNIMTEGQFDEQMRRMEHIIDLKLGSLPCDEAKELMQIEFKAIKERITRLEGMVTKMILLFVGNIIGLIGILITVFMTLMR